MLFCSLFCGSHSIRSEFMCSIAPDSWNLLTLVNCTVAPVPLEYSWRTWIKQVIPWPMVTSWNGNMFRYWPFVRGIHRSPVDSPYKGQWRGALMLSLICAWTNGWANNRDAGDLRPHRTHYAVTVMLRSTTKTNRGHISWIVHDAMSIKDAPRNISRHIRNQM